MSKIDWSAFDEFSEDTCYCNCGHVYRSHAKIVMEPKPHSETRKPCPQCGKTDNCRRVSSDRERMTIGK